MVVSWKPKILGRIMADEIVVPEVPVVPVPAPETPVAVEVPNRRAEVEKQVMEANGTVVVPEVPAEIKTEEVVPVDPVKKIKEAVQGRIDKLTAQKKSAEEELAELKAENERLKSERLAPKTPEAVAPNDDTPPTPEQVEAYIAKMSEEGNHKEVAAATRYLIKLEKEIAFKEVEERQTKQVTDAAAAKAKSDAEMKALANDYVVYGRDGQPDTKSDLTLANKDGLLFKTALSLYNDKELHKDFYNDANVVHGFRRAVSDAYRELHQQGLIANAPKEEVIPRTPRLSLADPSAEIADETPVNTSNLSDADKVREEIKRRNQNRFLRPVPQ
jgi:hypothetical protein